MAKVWKFGRNTDTDQIVPGRYAPFMLKEGDDVQNYAFVDAHPAFNQHAQAGDILLADENFGCGSSREYAPVALKKRGVGAIIAKSFARIFYRNAVNLGIPVYIAPAIVDSIPEGATVTLDFTTQQLIYGDQLFELPPLPPFAQSIIAAGGITRYVRTHGTFPAG
jgi:methanogen homoaconitase small subunit